MLEMNVARLHESVTELAKTAKKNKSKAESPWTKHIFITDIFEQ